MDPIVRYLLLIYLWLLMVTYGGFPVQDPKGSSSPDSCISSISLYVTRLPDISALWFAEKETKKRIQYTS